MFNALSKRRNWYFITDLLVCAGARTREWVHTNLQLYRVAHIPQLVYDVDLTAIHDDDNRDDDDDFNICANTMDLCMCYVCARVDHRFSSILFFSDNWLNKMIIFEPLCNKNIFKG